MATLPNDTSLPQEVMEGSITGGPGRRADQDLPVDFWLYKYKVVLCLRRDPHDWEKCVFAHRGEKARRRHPSRYQAVQCPEARAKKVCPRGEECPCTHHLFEYWLHPDRFRTCMCEHGSRCQRPICFFAHTPEEVRPLPQGQRVALDPGGSRRAKESAQASSSNSPAPSLQHSYSDPGSYLAAAAGVQGQMQMLYGGSSGGSMVMPDGSIATIPAGGGGVGGRAQGVLVGGDQMVPLLEPLRTADGSGAAMMGQGRDASTDVSPSLSPRWMAGQGLAEGGQTGGLSPNAVSPVFHQQQQAAGGLLLQGSPAGSLYAPMNMQYIAPGDPAAVAGAMMSGQDATAYQLSGGGADMLQPGMASLTMVAGGGSGHGGQQHRHPSPGSPLGSRSPGAGGVGLGFAVIDGQPVDTPENPEPLSFSLWDLEGRPTSLALSQQGMLNQYVLQQQQQADQRHLAAAAAAAGQQHSTGASGKKYKEFQGFESWLSPGEAPQQQQQHGGSSMAMAGLLQQAGAVPGGAAVVGGGGVSRALTRTSSNTSVTSGGRGFGMDVMGSDRSYSPSVTSYMSLTSPVGSPVGGQLASVLLLQEQQTAGPSVTVGGLQQQQQQQQQQQTQQQQQQRWASSSTSTEGPSPGPGGGPAGGRGGARSPSGGPSGAVDKLLQQVRALKAAGEASGNLPEGGVAAFADDICSLLSAKDQEQLISELGKRQPGKTEERTATPPPAAAAAAATAAAGAAAPLAAEGSAPVVGAAGGCTSAAEGAASPEEPTAGVRL